MCIHKLIENGKTKKAIKLNKEIEIESHKIKHLSDKELQELHAEYHTGMACTELLGDKPSKLVAAIDTMIEHELEKRNIKTLSDLEEDIWFSQRNRN